MSGTLFLLAVCVCGVVVGLMWVMAAYNTLHGARQKSRDLFSRMETQISRRHLLLRDLEAVAESAPPADRAALDAFRNARAEAQAAAAAASAPVKTREVLERLLATELSLDAALSRLLGALERQPAWKTNPLRGRLGGEIAAAGDEKSLLQSAYNESVSAYNAQLQTLPAVWIAPFAGFSREFPLQEPAAPEPEAPKGRFSASA